MQLMRSRQRGDTIVEVLIAIAVIGAVLGGAYVVVNNSANNNQAAQERTAAVGVAESQLELLRSYAAAGTLPADGEKFCLSDTGNVVKTTITGVLPAASDAGYPAQCITDERYVAGIVAGGTNKFTVYVTWDGLTGGRSQVSIAYKVYQ